MVSSVSGEEGGVPSDMSGMEDGGVLMAPVYHG